MDDEESHTQNDGGIEVDIVGVADTLCALKAEDMQR